MTFDLDTIRARFPALSVIDGESPRFYFDNPGGTQVSQNVVDSMSDCLIQSNANVQGYFRTSKKVDAIVEQAHEAVADLLNAPSRDEIIFGQNMTTLTLHVSREALIYSVSGYNTDHHSQLHGDLGNASTNAR